MPSTYLDPNQVYDYANQRNSARSNWANQISGLDYNTNRLNQDWGINTGYEKTTWDQNRTQVPGQFNRRGLYNSGVHARGLGEFNQARNQQFGQLARDFQDKKAGYAMQRGVLDQSYYNNMFDINNQEALNRANIAATLRASY